MKRIVFSIMTFCLFGTIFSQEEINNTKSDHHKQVKGTKIFIVPPDGFTEANNFQGFQQVQSNSSIVVSEIPGSFDLTTKGFDENVLKTQGMTLNEKREIKINGYDGLFVKTEQFAYENYFTKYILAFGDNKTTFMIVGIFPQKFSSNDTDILKSIHSIVYEPNLAVDIFSMVNFKIDSENTKLKFAKLIMGSLLYTADGKVPTESDDKTSFSAGQSLSNLEIKDKKLYTLLRVRKLPYDNIRIEGDIIKQTEVDGISGYEILAYGTDKKTSKEALLYLVMLYSDNGYYIFNGTAENDFQNNVELFKQLTHSFKRK